MSSRDFKVGDRVELITNLVIPTKGLRGTIIYIENYSNDCIIEFDINFGGHSGGLVKGKSGHCWIVLKEDIKSIVFPDNPLSRLMYPNFKEARDGKLYL